MLDVVIQNLNWDAILPHVDTHTTTYVIKRAYKLTPGLGFPVFVTGALIVWFAFLWLIGAFKK